LLLKKIVLCLYDSDDRLLRAQAKGKIFISPSKPLAAFPPSSEFILSPCRIDQVFIKDNYRSWHNSVVHGLQYIKSRAVQIAVDIRKCQRLLIRQFLQKLGNSMFEQALMKNNIALDFGYNSGCGVAFGWNFEDENEGRH
jgi:hypothetical protein